MTTALTEEDFFIVCGEEYETDDDSAQVLVASRTQARRKAANRRRDKRPRDESDSPSPAPSRSSSRDSRGSFSMVEAGPFRTPTKPRSSGIDVFTPISSPATLPPDSPDSPASPRKKTKLSPIKLTPSKMDASPSYPSTSKQLFAHEEASPLLRRTATEPINTFSASSPTKANGPLKSISASALESPTKSRGITSPAQPTLKIEDVLHNDAAQIILDAYDVPTGVRFWIAKAVGDRLFAWSEITPAIAKKLEGTNAQVMPKLKNVFKDVKHISKYTKYNSRDEEVWRQLDLERAAREEGRDRALGCCVLTDSFTDYRGRTHLFPTKWYGGRVEFRARLSKADKRFAVVLDKPRLGKSTQFSRLADSENRLHIRGKEAKGFTDWELTFLKSHKLRISGKLFTLICAKDGRGYVGCFSDSRDEIPNRVSAKYAPISFLDCIRVLNNPAINDEQLLSKWVNRMELLFSTSIPVINLKRENIVIIDDIEGDAPTSGKKDARYTKTDGHGWCSRSFLASVTRRMGLHTDEFSTVQGRVFGSKGLWSLHPTDHDLSSPEKLWIRKSQLKIKITDRLLHPSHLIFNLVRLPKVSEPSITRQVVLNLSAHSIPNRIFIELMKESLRKRVEPLLQWEGNGSMLVLSQWITRRHGIVAARLSKAASGKSRAYGFSQEFNEMDVDIDENVSPHFRGHNSYGINSEVMSDTESESEDPEMNSNSSLWLPGIVERDSASGYPVSSEEVLIHLLQAGFEPHNQPVVQHGIENLIKWEIEKPLSKFSISVEYGRQAWIIPDPLGILEPGQIYFKLSSGKFPAVEGQFPSDTLTGPVLIGRNPVRFLSDIQRHHAVDIPQLAHWPNVIIMSTRGPDSAAHILAGGDFDGDTVFAIWEPSLLQHFVNADLVSVPDLSKEFEKSIKLAHAYLKEQSGWSLDEKEAHMVHALSIGFQRTYVGIYSNLHEHSAYFHGYNDSQTIRLGAICNAELDSKKQGQKIMPEIVKKDQKTYSLHPYCLMSTAQQKATREELPTRELKQLSQHIANMDLDNSKVLDALLIAAGQEKDSYMNRWTSKKNQTSPELDPDIMSVYHDQRKCAQNLVEQVGARVMLQDLKALDKHVQSIFDRYMDSARALARKAIDKRGWQRDLSELVRQFNENRPSMQNPILTKSSIRLYLVSSAYQIAYDTGSLSKLRTEFPFRMDFASMCFLKAGAANAACVSFRAPFADSNVAHERITLATAIEHGDVPECDIIQRSGLLN